MQIRLFQQIRNIVKTKTNRQMEIVLMQQFVQITEGKHVICHKDGSHVQEVNSSVDKHNRHNTWEQTDQQVSAKYVTMKYRCRMLVPDRRIRFCYHVFVND